jgi:hypothetical protein
VEDNELSHEVMGRAAGVASGPAGCPAAELRRSLGAGLRQGALSMRGLVCWRAAISSELAWLGTELLRSRRGCKVDADARGSKGRHVWMVGWPWLLFPSPIGRRRRQAGAVADAELHFMLELTRG